MVRKAVALMLTLTALTACGSPGASTGNTAPASSAAASPTASSSAAPSGSTGSSASASPSGSTSGSASAAPSGSTSGSVSAAPSGSAGGSAESGAGALSAQEPIVLETITQLATQTGVQASNLRLQSSEEVEWSDGSLGCSDPAASYIQVITPGYKMVFTDGTRTYDVHASQNGRAVWCDNGTPQSLTGN